jgi:radical SAM protein with 4Fe4S-binding SPASM domain
LIDKEYFCAAAWTALYLDTDGTVDFCCTANNRLGNIKEQSIQEILNGTRAREIRTRMINNQRVEGCVACWRQDPAHRMQTFFNNKYVHQQPIGGARAPDADLNSDFYQSSTATKLKYLDLRWNNTCNFACIYCGEKYSSLWSEENHRHQGLIPITTKATREDKQVMREDLSGTFADVDWIYFAGGEPLAIKENIGILDQLHAVNPSCTLQINTNLSMLDGNPMFDRLKKFSNVRWMVSGETMGDVFEYVRWPGNWSMFTHNIQRIAALRDQGHQITFNLVAMNINHLTLWDYVDYLLDLDVVEKPSDININMYNSRESSQPFAIQRMPDEWKDQARDRLARSAYQIRGVDNYLDALTDPLPALNPRWSGLEHTVNRLQMLDQQRAKDSREIFPHVYEYISRHPE